MKIHLEVLVEVYTIGKSRHSRRDGKIQNEFNELAKVRENNF